MSKLSQKEYRVVTKPIRKLDAMQLVTGQPVYTDDVTPQDCLVVKLLRSPHAHALITDIDTEKAMAVPGAVAVYTYKDVPQERFTTAGQTYPEPSAYDRLLLDRRVRFVGDPVAIIAAETKEAAEMMLTRVKVSYEVLPAVLDFHTAKDNELLVHPEDNWRSLCPVGADNRRNLVAHEEDSWGDVDAAFAQCAQIVEKTVHCKANNQAMMETFRTYCEIDTYGRLHVISSTQIIFHVRRIVSNALGIPKSKIRVTKPRIGGGFGAKQSVVAEIYPAFVTWMTKRPSKLIYTREECQIAASPRHEMEVHVKVGADAQGHIRAMDMYTLSNSGAYSEHGPTTVGLSGHKSISLYANQLQAYRFNYDVVYTNLQSAGAFRGYGAPQGIFAVESAVNELADKLGISPIEIREINMTREGNVIRSYYGETATSCALDCCLARAKEKIGWDDSSLCTKVDDHTVRAKGMAIAMQGSGISNVDVGSATVRLTEDGGYALVIGAADMGTGCDTILAQMVAEMMECDMSAVTVYSADTDFSPYDSGSYASSTTYVTGKAVERACLELQEKICALGASMLELPEEQVVFTAEAVQSGDGSKAVSLMDIATRSMCGNTEALQVTATHSSPTSPPPYMVGMVELDIDIETGEAKVANFVAVADCGTVVNENLARIQLEGGIVQGIGMALYENVTYMKDGSIAENSLMEYKIPSRMDIGKLDVEFESSYEPSGPFGAKSIGELVIDTPVPAIAHAIYEATGIWLSELPFTPEKILEAIEQGGKYKNN
ncbi:MAG: molybdopterin-dependent oxidoreductase [Eubacterium sp.]|nr:molybdopterin-dependent oxidoreductase [Eubacterium sp.]